MMFEEDTNNFRIRREWRRRRLPGPPEMKLGIAEIKRISSYLRLLKNIEDDAIGIFNRARIGKKITQREATVDLACPSVYLACEKHNLGFTDEQYEKAIGKKIKEIIENADSIKEFKNPLD